MLPLNHDISQVGLPRIPHGQYRTFRVEDNGRDISPFTEVKAKKTKLRK